MQTHNHIFFVTKIIQNITYKSNQILHHVGIAHIIDILIGSYALFDVISLHSDEI